MFLSGPTVKTVLIPRTLILRAANISPNQNLYLSNTLLYDYKLAELLPQHSHQTFLKNLTSVSKHFPDCTIPHTHPVSGWEPMDSLICPPASPPGFCGSLLFRLGRYILFRASPKQRERSGRQLTVVRWKPINQTPPDVSEEYVIALLCQATITTQAWWWNLTLMGDSTLSRTGFSH